MSGRVAERKALSSSVEEGEDAGVRQFMDRFLTQVRERHRRYCQKGLRVVVEKHTEPPGPLGGRSYRTFDGFEMSAPRRMNARQLREFSQGALAGCVSG